MKKSIDHLGREYPSIKAMCEAHGVSLSMYNARIRSGVDLETALTAPSAQQHGRRLPVKDHEGREYPSVTAMCEAHGIPRYIYEGRMSHGADLKTALTRPVRTPRPSRRERITTDHTGRTFPSENQMCLAWGTSQTPFRRALQRGLTVEQALTGDRPRKDAPPVSDGNGNEYPSTDAMCHAYGIHPATFRDRIKRGLSVREALTRDPKKHPNQNGKPCTDHLGNTYPSNIARCAAYGIKPITLRARLRAGLDLETALTHPVEKGWHPRRTQVKDHLGNIYASKRDMCKAYGISQATVNDRLSRGMDLETALTKKPANGRRPAAVTRDHLGREYPSKAAMCRAYGIGPSTLDYRLSRGMDLEAALTEERAKTYVPRFAIKDHEGNEYRSMSAMCHAYGINARTFASRMERGMDLQSALTTPPGSIASSKKQGTVKLDIPAKGQPVTDHLGNTYPNLTAMAAAYRIDPQTLRARLSSGRYDLKTVLTEPVRHAFVPDGNAVKDHLGNEYPSKRAMCVQWKISTGTFQARLRSGATLKEALTGTGPRKSQAERKASLPRTDHLGREYPSMAAMCRAHGIDAGTVKYRLSQGMGLKAALTIKTGRKKTA